jgi:hypothetical protein
MKRGGEKVLADSESHACIGVEQYLFQTTSLDEEKFSSEHADHGKWIAVSFFSFWLL